MRANRHSRSVPGVITAALLVVVIFALDLSAQGFRRNEPPRPDFIPADYNDYQHTLTQLGITQMRRGRDGRGPDTSDDATANPWKDSMPALLVLSDGTPVTSAVQWPQRRAEIVEEFEREVYGRIPDNAPVVNWEVTATEEGESGGSTTAGIQTCRTFRHFSSGRGSTSQRRGCRRSSRVVSGWW